MAGGVPRFVPMRAPAGATTAAEWTLDFKVCLNGVLPPAPLSTITSSACVAVMLQELDRAVGPRTKAILINTPHNPLGKIFTRDELTQIAGQARSCPCLSTLSVRR